MRAPETSAQERVKAATKEAHLRVLLQALNKWALDPLSATLRAAVLFRMRKYREAVERGLCPSPGGVPAFARHKGGLVNDEELEAVAELLKLQSKTSRGLSAPEVDLPPWE